jgi:hypothetical protein
LHASLGAAVLAVLCWGGAIYPDQPERYILPP